MGQVKHAFQAEVTQVLRLVINSLYSNPEIFLRELISNASDALDKRRFAALQRPELAAEGEQLKVRLHADKQAGTLTIWDNGIGMSAEELAQSLGTIAWSGSRDFLEKLKQASEQPNDAPKLIGQFGVGFYSAYLVSDRVEVVSRAAGSTSAHRWESDGREGFTIDDAERDQVGTSVILHLRDEHKEYLEPVRLRQLVNRYSDYIAHPIELEKSDAAGEFEAINQASALWLRSPKEIEPDQYKEFYKHLTHDWEEPLFWRHFHIEGTQMFSGLVFVPSRAPFDLFDPDPDHGVRLHVKRVLVMEHCKDLVPRWLRFVRGVIDSEDLPLNVSREMLQDSKVVRTIKKQVVSQVLDGLRELKDARPEEYRKFWQQFGAVLKEGIHFDPELKDKLAPLFLYDTAQTNEPVTLGEYRAKMPEGQAAIYYLTGASQALIRQSPHLEKLRAKGYDILMMSDPVDPFVMQSLTEYEGLPLVSASSADLKLDTEEDQSPPEAEQSKSLLERFQRVLDSRIMEVRGSKRLTDSPACLVVPEGGLPPHIERWLRAQQQNVPTQRRVLELNLEHPLVKAIQALDEKQPGSERVAQWVELIYDQALLAEGSPIDDPAQFAKRLTELMTDSAQSEAGTTTA